MNVPPTDGGRRTLIRSGRGVAPNLLTFKRQVRLQGGAKIFRVTSPLV